MLAGGRALSSLPGACPGCQEPCPCEVALPISESPRSFKGSSLCGAHARISTTLSKVLMLPLEPHTIHWLCLARRPLQTRGRLNEV